MTVLIAGGGIGGLSLALTCHQIGVPFQVFETSREIRPLGLGINVQPNAVRELEEMGFAGSLAEVGIPTQEFAMFSKFGLEIWSEPRGVEAGYKWPQYSLHRGKLQKVLYRELISRAGQDAVQTGWKVVGYENSADEVQVQLVSRDGESKSVSGKILIGADGINSSVRSQMVPDEGPPIWNGRVMWRGMSFGTAWRTGATMVMIGHDTQRFVAYPIQEPDPKTGLSLINWIAELEINSDTDQSFGDWNSVVSTDKFLPEFEDWKFEWIDVPELITSSAEVFEYPMVDRDPLYTWQHGRVSLIGDAAHVTYPVGSNGASQAIVDARKLGRAFMDNGVSPEALTRYESEVLPTACNIVLANRGEGPDAVMQWVEDSCGGQFERIGDVVDVGDLTRHAAKYKSIAGFSIDELNALPPTIDVGR
ncbi:MAG: flavin-dependent oxidoreductase [Dehalococcoidia bacterium]